MRLRRFLEILQISCDLAGLSDGFLHILVMPFIFPGGFRHLLESRKLCRFLEIAQISCDFTDFLRFHRFLVISQVPGDFTGFL